MDFGWGGAPEHFEFDHMGHAGTVDDKVIRRTSFDVQFGAPSELLHRMFDVHKKIGVHCTVNIPKKVNERNALRIKLRHELAHCRPNHPGLNLNT